MGKLLSAFLATVAAIAVVPTEVPAQEQASTYFSQIDADLTVRKVAVFPVSDNLDGIYARPIESHLLALVKAYHQWDLVDSSAVTAPSSVADLEDDPAEVRRLGAGIEADAFLVAQASKGPNGLNIKLNLFMKTDGKLLAQETLRDHARFEIPELKSQTQALFARLVRKIPYNGLVLSRQGNRVTINLGKSDGLSENQVISAVQIIKATRHPKFNFLVSTEKEVLGKVKVLKVEDTLSFGMVVTELDKGVIRRFHKIAGLDQVSYDETEDLGGGNGGSIMDRDDSQISFGKGPGEWIPTKPPAFGAVGLKAGVGSYNNAISLSTGDLKAKASFYPSLGVFGELWLNPNWIVRAELEQGVASTDNPRAGSAPSELNHQLTKYALMMGYNFLLQDDFFGPKLQVRGGFLRHQIFIDSSTPLAFTTTTYSGLLLGLYGSLPVTEEKDWYIGAGLNMVMFPSLQEKPYSSGGSDKNTVNDFTLWGEKKIRENLMATASLDFSLYSTSFTGSGSRPAETAVSMSQRHTRLSGGLIYMF